MIKEFDEGYALEFVTRGVRQALTTPGVPVSVEFSKLHARIELTLDEEDRKDPVFQAAIAGLMVSDLRKYVEGRKPRFGTTIRPLASIRIRDEEDNN